MTKSSDVYFQFQPEITSLAVCHCQLSERFEFFESP